jgi:hypothetical protein
MSSSDLIVHPGSPRVARLALAVIGLLALAAPGCASESPPDAATGTVVVPLVQTRPGGEVFHLANAVFDIVGAEGAFVTTVNGGGFEPQLEVSVPPGIVEVFLRDGWSLERSLDGGATFAPVSALLASFNPGVARVLANSPSTLELSFIVRDVNGTLQIKLGVITEPRELAGGYIVETATGALAEYAEGANRRLDFAVFYDLFSISTAAQVDGTKLRVYVANHVAVEFYNDELGVFANQIGPSMAGAFLTYAVVARPDGTFEVSGELSGGLTNLVFGPSVIDAITSPTLDAEGFPRDEFFYDSDLPFVQDTDFDTITGTLRMRHLIAGQPGPRQ